MFDFINGAISILVSGLLIAGFVGLGAVLVFELGVVFVFWIKHAYINDRKKFSIKPT